MISIRSSLSLHRVLARSRPLRCSRAFSSSANPTSSLTGGSSVPPVAPSTPSQSSQHSPPSAIDASLSRFYSAAATEQVEVDAPKPSVFSKVICIGAGKMAQAVVAPMIQTKLQDPKDIIVYDVNDAMIDNVQDQISDDIEVAESIASAIASANSGPSNLIVCGVKPQNLTPAFFAECRKGVEQAKKSHEERQTDASGPKWESPIFLSIIAGKEISTFDGGITGCDKIVRSMPNTPATVGQGMTVWNCTPNLTSSDRNKVKEVLTTFGASMYVDDEQFIDIATSISGSGPAYIFMLMESMVDAGVHMGFPRDKATTLVYQTMLGSTLYAMEKAATHPAILRNDVTSPNGTTASALYELENGRFRTVIKDAMWACYRRSLEMGNQDSNVGPGRQAMPGGSSDEK